MVNQITLTHPVSSVTSLVAPSSAGLAHVESSISDVC
jgi:hypothetical protein